MEASLPEISDKQNIGSSLPEGQSTTLKLDLEDGVANMRLTNQPAQSIASMNSNYTNRRITHLLTSRMRENIG
jgi:hypothetical protein